MNIEHMVKMVNEISAFFGAEPDKAEAARNVATHLRRFWEPRMRQQIIAHYERGGAGLEDVARNAVAILAQESVAKSNA